MSLPIGRHAVQTALGTSPLDALSHLRLEPQPAPEPKDDEILIEVKAATVGWVDLLMSSGQYQHVPEPPYTPGLEFAGVIAAVGPDVAEVSIGDPIIADGLYTGPRSLGAHRRFGGFARWALAPARAAIPLPPPLSFDEGACLLGGYETAYHALVHRARVQPGEVVLVLGATGSTGLAAVQLAKHLGATVIAAGRTPSKLERVASHGADHTLRTTDDAGKTRRFRDDLKAMTGGRGVDIVYDAVGGDASTEALRGTTFGGRFVLVGWTSTPFAARGGHDPNVLPTNLILMKGVDVLGSPAAIAVHRDPSLRDERLRAILGWAREGALRPLVSKAYGLDDLHAALRDKWASRHVGNVVVHPTGTAGRDPT